MSVDNTLNIEAIRLQRDYPLAELAAATLPAAPARPQDPENHPNAAAAARARIAALPDLSPLTSLHLVPATPTADLITDRLALAANAGAAAGVVRPLPPIVQPVLTAAGIFLLTLLLFKAPIILSQVGYMFNKPKPAVTTTASVAGATVSAANTISIPKINVQAPVVYEPSVQESAIETALQSGVVHYGNTALPGQVGNVAIFGHSSNDWWQPGNYKFVFVLLDKLSPGDHVTVDYNSKAYIYEVTGSKIVDPTDVAVLYPTSTPTLTLITCSPPGTSLRRLVVTAKQINPDPTQATATTTTAPTTTTSSNLPSAAPSLTDQLKQAWNGVVNGFKSLFGAGSTPAASPSPSSAPANQLPAAN